MTRILLGHSYYLRFDPKLYAAMQPYPPLGTMYAASYLRARGHEVALFDAMLAGGEEDWSVLVDRYSPKYAILYEDNFNYLSKMCLLRMREAAFRMISMAKKRGCVVIASGADATDQPEAYLEHGADFVVHGEGEETVSQLIESREMSESAPIARVPGLVWRNESGMVERSAARPNLANLDAIPFPAWDLADISGYRSLWLTRHGYFSMNVVTTRGCPYHCNWCAKPIWGQRYNSRSPENVIAELQTLKGSFRPDHIWFADDIFGLKPGWIERFGELAADRNCAIPFKCQMRVDLINRPVAIALQAARCDTVWLGAESGSQKILDAMEKGTTVEQIREARRLLADEGIKVGFFLQFGYPGESRDDVDKTLQMVRELRPDDIGISVSYPLPGTRFYARVKAALGRRQNWVDSDDLAMLYRGPFPQKFYRAVYHAAHSEFRMRKAIDRLRAAHPRPDGRGAFSPRGVAVILKNWFLWQANRRRLAWFEENPDTLAMSREN